MNLESSTKIYGLLGYPVKHSLSPLMHNAAFKALNINAEYRLFEKKPEEVENFIRSLIKDNISGLNVTVPHKERIIPLLDEVSEEAGLIGAVNTIKVSDNTLKGFNTDGEGFIRHLGELKFSPRGKSVAMLGAGGAAKAVSVYLVKEKIRRLHIFDSDRQKLDNLISYLKDNFTGIDFTAAKSTADLFVDRCGLLINATPVGMRQSDACLVDAKFISSDMFVYDLIYNPAKTKLLVLAEEKKASFSNGLGMLLYQGARSFEIWTGMDAPVEIMRNALKEGIKKL